MSVIVRQTESERRASQAIEATSNKQATSKSKKKARSNHPLLLIYLSSRVTVKFSLITRTQACPGHSALAVRDDITVIHFLKKVSGLVS